jgi:hypothetical protein
LGHYLRLLLLNTWLLLAAAAVDKDGEEAVVLAD